VQGSQSANVYYGFTYSFGNDGQSIPEFNADYKLNALGVTTGFYIPM
jgi:hypothetical protein